jgi:Fe-S-cluster-containing hydrogenase component 2
LYRPDNCSGCRICALVCSLTHEGKFGPVNSRLLVRADGPSVYVEFSPECDECARCAVYCPCEAIEKGTD